MTVAEILSDLSDHGFEDTPTERKLAVVNETLWDVAALEPWSILVKGIDLTFSGSSGTPTNFPADFSAVHSMSRYADPGGKIKFVRLDDVREHSYVYGALAPARFYTFVGPVMVLYGTPGAGTGATMEYYYVPAKVDETTVEAGIWLPKQYHRQIIVNGALYKLYLMEDDPELAQAFQQLFDRAVDRARVGLHIQQYADTDFIHAMAEDYEDWDY
jgi:hypothetical protein